MAHKPVVVRNVILSYPYLTEPQTDDSGKQKYSAAFVATEEGAFEELEALMKTVAEEKWGTKAAGMIKSGALYWPVRDDVAAKGYDTLGGVQFVNARSERRPALVDQLVNKVEGERIDELFYAGARVNVSLSVFAYDNPKKKGVGVGLGNIQFVADGQRIAGRTNPEDDFEPMNVNMAEQDISSIE